MAAPLSLTKEQEQAHFNLLVSLALSGKGPSQISKELGISRSTVYRQMQTERFKDQIKALSDEAVNNAKAHLRSNAERLSPKALATLESLLDSESGKDKAEGLRAYFRLIGLDSSDKTDGQGSLVIQLPQMNVPKTVESEIVIGTPDQSGSDELN